MRTVKLNEPRPVTKLAGLRLFCALLRSAHSAGIMSIHTDRLRALAGIVILRDYFEKNPDKPVTSAHIVRLCNTILRLEKTLQQKMDRK